MRQHRTPILTLACAIFLIAVLIFCAKPNWEPPAPIESTEGLRYQLLSDDTYSVSIGSATKEKKIVIPPIHNGKAVTAIDNRGFSEASKLESIIIPESITEIGYLAFNDCTKLKRIELPSGLRQLGEQAFCGCTALTEITVPDGVTVIEYATFLNCKRLERVTLGDSVTHIEDYAFLGCTKLTDWNLPNSLVWIGVFALPDIEMLETVEHEDLLYLGNSENPYLVLIGPTRAADRDPSVSIHPDTVIILYGAFENHASLAELQLPAGLLSIGEHAFYHCPELASAVIPTNVQRIGRDAFMREPDTPGNIVLYLTGVNGTQFDKNVMARVFRYSEAPPDADDYYLSWTYIDGKPTLWSSLIPPPPGAAKG